MTSSERGFSPSEQTEVSPVIVEFNKPFMVKPPENFARFTLENLAGFPSGKKKLVTIPLAGANGKGELKIMGCIAPSGIKSNQKVHLPFGKPRYRIAFHASDGRAIIKAIPISFTIVFGPLSHKEIVSGSVNISMLANDREFSATTTSSPHGFIGFEPRAIITNQDWINVETGRQGPLYVPSGINFDDIQFMIRRS